MALFTGHVVNKVDRKGRVSVPASFRNELVRLSFPGIVVFPSPEGLPAIDGAGIDKGVSRRRRRQVENEIKILAPAKPA